MFLHHVNNYSIHGPSGEIEVLLTIPSDIENTDKTKTAVSRWAIVCHPHPLFGGSMKNKIVTTLFRTFDALGLGTIRFNFRGVGRSAGKFDEGKGELDDLWAVITWLKQTQTVEKLWLSGFSFGAYIAATAAGQLLAGLAPAEANVFVERVVLIAPPVENFPIHTPILPVTCPWLVVQGEKDDVVSPQAVFSWIKEQAHPPTLLSFSNAGHFFHGELLKLQKQLQLTLST